MTDKVDLMTPEGRAAAHQRAKAAIANYIAKNGPIQPSAEYLKRKGSLDALKAQLATGPSEESKAADTKLKAMNDAVAAGIEKRKKIEAELDKCRANLAAAKAELSNWTQPKTT